MRKSTRRSRRGPEATLEQLAARVAHGDRVVFVCGAGISAASGIPTFRGAENSVWSEFVMEWGTRRRFLRAPAAWYTTFWEKKFPAGWLTNCAPNAGHTALARIAAAFRDVCVVTQNVDGLQRRAVPAMAHQQLVEAHGRMGLHKCSSSVDGACRYANLESIEFPPSPPTTATASAAATVPACPLCGSPCLPQVLLFDEDYESHAFYRFGEVSRAFAAADAFVFVGTSASVGVTAQALAQARARNVPLFTVNMLWDDALAKKRDLDVSQALGPCEVLLPMLAELLLAVKTTAAGDAAPAAVPAVVKPRENERVGRTGSLPAQEEAGKAAASAGADVNHGAKRQRIGSAAASKQTMRSTCRVCLSSFDAMHNDDGSCRFHTSSFVMREKNKVLGVIPAPKATRGFLHFWDCCGSDDPNAPGCASAKHQTYDDIT